VGIAALVGVLFAAALIAILALRNANARESHSKDVTVATLQVKTVSADLDSALRGYVLSGNPRFLTLFRDAQGRVPNEIGDLRSLVRQDAPQRLRAASAARELHQYLTDYALNVIAIAQISRAAAAGPAAGSEGKRRTDEIRQTLNGLLAVEDRRASEASAHGRAVANDALGVGVGALLVSTALVLLFGAVGSTRRSAARAARRRRGRRRCGR